MTDSTAVTVRPELGEVQERVARSPEAERFNVLQRMAKAVAASGLFGIKTEAQAVALMLIAEAEGRHPALAARDYDIIQGRPSKKAEAMLRDFLAAGGSVKWEEISDKRCAAVFSHPQGGSAPIDWDMERAKKAGLKGKDMYEKYPRQMLRSRVVSEGVRTVYPAATSGMYVPEEVQDFGAERREAAVGDHPVKNIGPSEGTGSAALPTVVVPIGFNVDGEPIAVGTKRNSKFYGKPLSSMTEEEIVSCELWATDKGAPYEQWRQAAADVRKLKHERAIAVATQPLDSKPLGLQDAEADERRFDRQLAARESK